MNIKTNDMNPQIKNYLFTQEKIKRIERITTHCSEVSPSIFKRFVLDLLDEGFEIEDVCEYLTIKAYEISDDTLD